MDLGADSAEPRGSGLVAATCGLADIRTAQEDFLAKKFTGKLVLVPPRAARGDQDVRGS